MLSRRRVWVEGRAGGSYDRREVIALKYAIALLESAQELGVIEDLELLALKRGAIHRSWVMAVQEADRKGESDATEEKVD